MWSESNHKITRIIHVQVFVHLFLMYLLHRLQVCILLHHNLYKKLWFQLHIILVTNVFITSYFDEVYIASSSKCVLYMQAQADNFSAREVAESMGLANTNLPWLGRSNSCHTHKSLLKFNKHRMRQEWCV